MAQSSLWLVVANNFCSNNYSGKNSNERSNHIVGILDNFVVRKLP